MRGNDDEIIDNWYADLYDQTETQTEDVVQSNYFDKEVSLRIY